MYTKLRANNNRLMNTEMKSWKQNKMEEKRLALKNEEVDKHMLNKRKSLLHEKDLLNKDIQDTISKTTPTTDEYLSRSQHRRLLSRKGLLCQKVNKKSQRMSLLRQMAEIFTTYDTWRARERERLDRRYRGLYKTYMREFSDLGIDEKIINKARKKASEKTDGASKVEKGQKLRDEDSESEHEDEELDTHAELLDFSKLKLNERRRYSVATTSAQYVPTDDDQVRRRSAGNVIPLHVLQQLRSSSLPAPAKDVQSFDDTTGDPSTSTGTDKAEQDNENQVDVEEQTVYDKDSRGRRASLAVTSDLTHSKDMHDIVYPGRRGRRASLTVPSDLVTAARKDRRGSNDNTSFQTPMGARLSRRSSIPNIEIPMMYGN